MMDYAQAERLLALVERITVAVEEQSASNRILRQTVERAVGKIPTQPPKPSPDDPQLPEHLARELGQYR